MILNAAAVPHRLCQDDVYEGYYLKKNTICVVNVWWVYYWSGSYNFLISPTLGPWIMIPRYMGPTPTTLSRNATWMSSETSNHLCLTQKRRTTTPSGSEEGFIYLLHTVDAPQLTSSLEFVLADISAKTACSFKSRVCFGLSISALEKTRQETS